MNDCVSKLINEYNADLVVLVYNISLLYSRSVRFTMEASCSLATSGDKKEEYIQSHARVHTRLPREQMISSPYCALS